MQRDPVPSSPDLVASIADARADVTAASQQLTGRANDVFRATATCVAELVEAKVEAFVLGQPERTAKLGRAGIERLRAELAAALAKVPVDTAKRLAGAFAWTFPHEAAWIGESDRSPLFEGGSDLPWMIDDAVRATTATAGRLAAEAGYEVAPRSHWELGGDGEVLRYLGPFPVPSRLLIAVRSYSDARLRYFRRLRTLRRREAEKSARDARLEEEVERESALQPAVALWARAEAKAG